MPTLVLIFAVGGCAHTTATATATTPARAPTPAPNADAKPAHPAAPPTTATPTATAPASATAADPVAAQKAAQAALAAGRYDEALDHLAPLAASDGKHAASIAYLRATALLYKEDFAGAAQLFEELLARAQARHDAVGEAWPHNALTWVRWAEHDQKGALDENEAVAHAVANPALTDVERREPLLHYWWDRAYLLEEQPATRKLAAEARRKYDALARLPQQHDGIAVLAAFFAVVEGDGKRALAEARKVDAAKDDDVQDLYVLALARDAGGDHEGAQKLRAQIAASLEYPMKPVILQRIAFDKRR